MKTGLLRSLRELLQRERRELVETAGTNQATSGSISEARIEEFEEKSQRERDAVALESLAAVERARLNAIDAALERMDAGKFDRCAICGSVIEEDRLIADPAAAVCINCACEQARPDPRPSEESEFTAPEAGRLPPDLALLDDHDLQEHLLDLLRQDQRIDAQEVQLAARNGVIYLEGALASEPEHQMLLNILTDIAGVQEIVDHLEIQQLAWEHPERSTAAPAGENQPTAILIKSLMAVRKTSPSLTKKDVAYDPPDNPPPSQRKD
jgi:DnaK suppressor protein